MRALVAISCAALVMVLPVAASAHAVVTRSSIGEKPLAAGQATQVTLYFNSAIETSHTTVDLIGADGKATPLALVPGEHAPGSLVVELPALDAGSYGLRYRVLAADGHVTENLLRFRVGAAP